MRGAPSGGECSDDGSHKCAGLGPALSVALGKTEKLRHGHSRNEELYKLAERPLDTAEERAVSEEEGAKDSMAANRVFALQGDATTV